MKYDVCTRYIAKVVLINQNVLLILLLINIASKKEETKTCKNINTGAYPLS